MYENNFFIFLNSSSSWTFYFPVNNEVEMTDVINPTRGHMAFAPWKWTDLSPDPGSAAHWSHDLDLLAYNSISLSFLNSNTETVSIRRAVVQIRSDKARLWIREVKF